MVTLRRVVGRALVVVAVLVGALVVGAATTAAQPTSGPVPPVNTAPPTAPAAPPSSPGATATTTPAAPGDAPADDDDDCSGHIKIPGIDACTPLPSPGQYAEDAVTDAGKSVLSDLVDWVLRGYVWITKYAWQLFVSVDVDATGSTTAVQKVNDMTGSLQVVAVGLGLLVALMQILVQRMMLTGDNAAPEAFAGFLRWALSATMAAPTLLALSAASDALAQWMFTSAAGPGGPPQVVFWLEGAR